MPNTPVVDVPKGGAQDRAAAEARKAAKRDEVKGRAKARGFLDHGDVQELRQDHDDGEVEAFLTEWLATPEGKQEAAKAGRSGMSPADLARLVVRGR